MGSLDISLAKDQFIQLLTAVRSAQLPQFTIWMDQKLAEYKVFGKVPGKIPDQDYPHWIRQALQQHFKSFFGDAAPSVDEEPVYPEPSAPSRPASRKRHSEIDSTMSKLPRLSQERMEQTLSPRMKHKLPIELSEISSRVSGSMPFEHCTNSQSSGEVEEIVIKDEGLSDEELYEQSPPFTLQVDKLHSINNSAMAPLPPLSSAFGMRPPMQMGFVPSPTQQLIHRFPMQPMLLPNPKFHVTASSSADHTPQSSSKAEPHAPKSESNAKSVRVIRGGGWRRGYEQMLAQNGYMGSLDDISVEQLDSTLAQFFSRARKLDGSPYSQRSYMMRKVDLDKIMITHLGLSINELPEATRAYKAKLQEFKISLVIGDDMPIADMKSAVTDDDPNADFKSALSLTESGRIAIFTNDCATSADDHASEVFEAITETFEIN